MADHLCSNFDCDEFNSNGGIVPSYPISNLGIADLNSIGQNDVYLSFICNRLYTVPPGSE